MFDTPEKKALKRKSMKVSDRAGTVHAYGCRALIERRRSFHEVEAHKVEIFDVEYRQNPWMFQYDLEIEIFLNYDQIKSEALDLARDEEERKWIEENGPTGLAPHEHLFIAAEIRWPIKRMEGHWFSKLTPHPWIQRQWELLNDYKFLTVFGGGGQGKTHGFAAFMCMIFDHFICTDAGAKCCFSTVNEDKLKSVVWPYISQRLYPVDESRSFSLYAGKGKVAGDYTIKRFGKKDKDTGAVMRGILVGHSVQDSAIEDKLTGSHGHIAYVYLLDEMQSTKEAPLKAAANFLSTPVYSWVIGAGNYNKDSDLLGRNAQPINGWASVNKDTGEWDAMNQLGHMSRVIHQHNDRSPAMLSKKWKKRCTSPFTKQCFLPNQERKNNLYPTEASRKTDEYRRMWEGFRNITSVLDLILDPNMIEQNGCDKPVFWDHKRRITNHLSFDPAQAEGDRNAVMKFSDGYCKDTGMWVWSPMEITTVPRSSNSLKYYEESTDWLLQYASSNAIKSGCAIMDWTSRSSHAELLRKKQFVINTLVYGQACPDGKTKDKKTGIVEDKILIEPNPEAIHLSKYAHNTCESLSALGAWALYQYVVYGRVRNINPGIIEPLKVLGLAKDIDKELFSREFEMRSTQAWGERFAVKSKKEFTKEYGFSPDLFDLLLQAAYYMLRFRGMIPSGSDLLPNSLMGQNEDLYSERENEKSDHITEMNSVWNHDLLPYG